MSNAHLISLITPWIMKGIILFVAILILSLFAVDVWAESIRHNKRVELERTKHLMPERTYLLLTAGPDTSKLVFPLVVSSFLSTLVAVIVTISWKG